MHERRINRIAIIGAGDMGSSVAADLVENGFDVTTCLRGRSRRSHQLATRAGMRAVTNLETLVAEADMLLSIIPPSAAVAFARQTVPLILETASKALYAEHVRFAPSGIKDFHHWKSLAKAAATMSGASRSMGVHRESVTFMTLGACRR